MICASTCFAMKRPVLCDMPLICTEPAGHACRCRAYEVGGKVELASWNQDGSDFTMSKTSVSCARA